MDTAVAPRIARKVVSDDRTPYHRRGIEAASQESAMVAGFPPS
jgi:hypothetical protein